MVIPTLFGRGSILLDEQHRFRLALCRLRDLSSPSVDPGVSPEAEAFSILARFRAALLDRFAAEEGEDYFGAITAIAPSLSDRVAQLEHEHWNLIEIAARIHEVLHAEAAPALSRQIERLVDCLDAQPPQTAFGRGDDLLGADEAPAALGRHFGRQQVTLAGHAAQGLAEQFFAVAIQRRGVEQIEAQVEGAANEPDGLLAVAVRALADFARPAGAQPGQRNLQAGAAQGSVDHFGHGVPGLAARLTAA